MPDLSAYGVKNWLIQQNPRAFCELAEAVRFAEQDPTLEAALVALGVALDDADRENPHGLTRRFKTDLERTRFQTVLAQLGQARLIRLLDWLSDPSQPQRHALLRGLFSPDAPDAAQAARSAIRHLRRQTLASRLLDLNRLSTIADCAASHRRNRRNTPRKA